MATAYYTLEAMAAETQKNNEEQLGLLEIRWREVLEFISDQEQRAVSLKEFLSRDLVQTNPMLHGVFSRELQSLKESIGHLRSEAARIHQELKQARRVLQEWGKHLKGDAIALVPPELLEQAQPEVELLSEVVLFKYKEEYFLMFSMRNEGEQDVVQVPVDVEFNDDGEIVSITSKEREYQA